MIRKQRKKSNPKAIIFPKMGGEGGHDHDHKFNVFFFFMASLKDNDNDYNQIEKLVSVLLFVHLKGLGGLPDAFLTDLV